jgi:hypothetical protein
MFETVGHSRVFCEELSLVSSGKRKSKHFSAGRQTAAKLCMDGAVAKSLKVLGRQKMHRHGSANCQFALLAKRLLRSHYAK